MRIKILSREFIFEIKKAKRKKREKKVTLKKDFWDL